MQNKVPEKTPKATKSFLPVGPTLHYSHKNVQRCWLLAAIAFSIACLVWSRLVTGTFWAFGVGDVLPSRLEEQYDVMGRAHSDETREVLWWYAASVGELKSSSPSYELVSYNLPPSRAEETSWSRVKALFSGIP